MNNGTSEAYDGEGVEIQHVETHAAAMLNKSEVEAQLDAAHRYPRDIRKFQKGATTLATLTEDVAQSCIYAVPREGKTITGPSVRLAEICLSQYGNMHAAARVLDPDAEHISAQGVAWDIEKNVRVTIEAKRRITGRNGKRYGADMIAMTGNAAASIAFRNAIFKVIPRALVDVIYAQVKEVAVGNAMTLSTKRAEVVARLQKMGVPLDRIFARVEKKTIDDVGLEELEILVGLGTAIKSKELEIDAAFPQVDNTADKAKKLDDDLAAKK